MLSARLVACIVLVLSHTPSILAAEATVIEDVVDSYEAGALRQALYLLELRGKDDYLYQFWEMKIHVELGNYLRAAEAAHVVLSNPKQSESAREVAIGVLRLAHVSVQAQLEISVDYGLSTPGEVSKDIAAMEARVEAAARIAVLAEQHGVVGEPEEPRVVRLLRMTGELGDTTPEQMNDLMMEIFNE